ncbi:MAG: aryl-sulfate sulfotransferase [Pseudomonadota bacterium]
MTTRRLPTPSCSLLACALAIGACHPEPPATDDTAPPPDSSQPDDTDQHDTAAPFFTDFAFTRSERVPTVVTATWHTQEPVACTLRYAAEGGAELTTREAGDPRTEHSVALVGLKPNASAALVVIAEAADGPESSDPQAFTTGELPVGLPTATLVLDDPTQSFHGYTLMPLINDSAWTSWICLFDSDAELVWAIEARHGANRARLAEDGGGVIFIDEDMVEGTDDVLGAVHSVAWDGTERWRFEGAEIHHDFADLGDDRYLVLAHTVRIVDEGLPTEQGYLGDALVEFTSAGDSHEIWNLFDDLDPVEHPSNDTAPAPDSGFWDWSHANYLTWVPESGEVLITLRQQDAIVAVDVDAGRMSWSLSNDWGTYHATDGETLLSWPHSVEPVEGGLAIFNQVPQWERDACSWAGLLTLDPARGTASVGRRYESEDCAHVFYLGSTEPLPNGHDLVVFSQSGFMEEVTPEGEVVRQVQSTFGWTMGYTHTIADLRPVAP